jgi:hypothetical protein
MIADKCDVLARNLVRALRRRLPRPDAIVSNVFGPILADVEGFTAAPDEILPL